MPKLGGAIANDSVFLLGVHRLLLLADGLGAAEIAAALDPLPLAADRGQGNLVEAGDPYSDSDRPLRLTVGFDVAAAPARLQREVFNLARLPHVTLDVLPDLKGLAVSDSLGSVAIDRGGEGISVTTTRRLGTTHFGWYRDDYAEILAGQTGLEQGLAVQLALSVAAHRALHNDYLVSPALAALRDTKAFWGRSTSSTTIEEAMFLAGLKSRMYRNVPIVVSSLGSMSITTGWLYDAAAMRLCGPLRKALAGALSPDATSEESGCVDHLLAIRSRLRDLIICRDEIAKLERREALGKDWPAGMRDRDSVIGGSGDDLVFRVDYHVTAALNAMSSILDNLAWIVCSREGLAVPSRQIGFDRIIDPRRPFGPTRASAWLAAAAQHDKLVREGLRCEHSAILPTIGLAWITGGSCRATQASPRLEVPRCSPPGYQETSPLMACLMAPIRRRVTILLRLRRSPFPTCSSSGRGLSSKPRSCERRICRAVCLPSTAGRQEPGSTGIPLTGRKSKPSGTAVAAGTEPCGAPTCYRPRPEVRAR